MKVKSKIRWKCPLPACKGHLELCDVYATLTQQGTEQYHTSPAACSWCDTSLPQAMNPKRHAFTASNIWLIDQRYQTISAAVAAAVDHAKMWLETLHETRNSRKVGDGIKKRKVSPRKKVPAKRR